MTFPVRLLSKPHRKMTGRLGSRMNRQDIALRHTMGESMMEEISLFEEENCEDEILEEIREIR